MAVMNVALGSTVLVAFPKVSDREKGMDERNKTEDQESSSFSRRL